MADFSDLRRRFIQGQHTIKNVRRDFHEWHSGRPRFAIWAIDIDCPATRQQISLANQHLSGLLLDGYCRKPHITLGICGFLSKAPKHTDDYGMVQLQADLAALGNARLKPFEIQIGALNSFSSAPFFHVHEPSHGVSALHQCLASSVQGINADFVPHVTVGLYAEALSAEMITKRLDAFVHADVGYLVNSISLMSYAAAEIGGELTTIADYHFDRMEIEWREPPPFD